MSINQPLVSVIIPTYNRATYILDSINSVLNQTYKNVQIIVVDDGSTDLTYELVKTKPVVEYYYQENAGQGAARTKGLSYCKGNLIASLDSDDIWYPDFLQLCVDRITGYQLDFVFANWDQQNLQGDFNSFLPNNKTLLPYTSRSVDFWIEFSSTELRHIYVQGCPSPSSSFIVKKEFLKLGWNSEMNIADDWFMQLDIVLKNKCKAACLITPVWRKRISGTNICDHRDSSEVIEKLYVEDLHTILNAFNAYLTKPERAILSKKFIEASVFSSFFKFRKERDFKRGFIQYMSSLQIDFLYTTKFTLKYVMYRFKRKYNLSKL